jgi:hypothetical protein
MRLRLLFHMLPIARDDPVIPLRPRHRTREPDLLVRRLLVNDVRSGGVVEREDAGLEGGLV